MTSIDLAHLDEVEAAATPGPWSCSESGAIVAPLSGTLVADVWEPTAATSNGAFIEAARDALPQLVAELRQARDRIAELEAYAYGCDAEGCVIPHSSWCEAAKKTAAANNGCTCGRPWTGHPQPHAMHCWTVNPPRAEVEEMRRKIASLQAARQEPVR